MLRTGDADHPAVLEASDLAKKVVKEDPFMLKRVCSVIQSRVAGGLPCLKCFVGHLNSAGHTSLSIRHYHCNAYADGKILVGR